LPSPSKDSNQHNNYFFELILKVIYAKPPSNNKLATAYVIAMPYIIINQKILLVIV